MKLQRIAILCCAIFASPVSRALEPAEAADLPPLATVRAAVMNQPSVLAAGAERRGDEAQRRRLLVGNYEPTVRASAQHRRVDELAANYREWDVGVERPLRLPEKARLDAQLGDTLVARGDAAYGDALHEASRALLRDWFAWMKAHARAREWQAQVDVMREQVTAVDKRVRAGDASKLEASLAASALDQTEAQYALARSQADSAATDLQLRQAGIVLPAAPVLAPPSALGQPFEFWREQLLQQSHELMLARNDSQRAQVGAKRADAEKRPDPTIGMRYASERSGGERIVGLSIAVPLPGSARTAAVDVASAAAQATAQREAAVLRKLEAEAASEYAAATAAFENWTRLSAASQRIDSNAALLGRAYTLGESPLADVLNARRQAIEARLAATLAQLDASEARYRLMVDAHLIWDFDEAAP